MMKCDSIKFDKTLKVICLFWFIAKIISYPLWLSTRSFPLVPVFDFFNNVPSFIHTILYSVSLISLLLILTGYKKIYFLTILFISELLSCSLDVARWQPWEYQYLFLTLIFIFFRNDDFKKYTAITIIVCSLYFYSGIHKLNGGFLYAVWEKMILKSFMGFSWREIKSYNLHYIGLLIPFFEITAGISLLFKSVRKYAAIFLIVMHVFIIMFLSPMGVDYNVIVLPWNTAMLLIIWILYIQQPIPFTANSLVEKYNIIIIAFWVILPALSFFKLWDGYISSRLYSGNSVHLTICLKENDRYKNLTKFISTTNNSAPCSTMGKISVHNWATSEIKVVPYAEIWYYKKFKEAFINKYPDIDADFIVYSYPYKENIELK